MAIVKPFKALRPPRNLAFDIASRPYDVLNSSEARIEAMGREKSCLHIIKPEIDFPEGVDLYSEAVYDKAVENYELWQTRGWLKEDEQAGFYIYSQTMHGKTQYGIVGCAAVADYENNIIKKHELTRPEKENDRIKHVYKTGANMEPVFFAYQPVSEIDQLVNSIVFYQSPEYDFTAKDGVIHRFWSVFDEERVSLIEKLFAEHVPKTYVADGHHRTAAAAKVGARMQAENPNHTGEEEYNFFLAVHFPANQLTIIDYNRVVKDLNGLNAAEFLARLKDNFTIENMGETTFKPEELHVFGMYLDGIWYKLVAHDNTYNDSDPIAVLDVNISSNYIFRDILGIEDLRTSKRIDFVGGIRGLEELERRVDSGEMKAAFALFPVSMQQLIDIADTDNIMPPKTTWFIPKLRSGLVVHKLN